MCHHSRHQAKTRVKVLLSLVGRVRADRGHGEPGIPQLEVLGPQEGKVQPAFPDLSFRAASPGFI